MAINKKLAKEEIDGMRMVAAAVVEQRISHTAKEVQLARFVLELCDYGDKKRFALGCLLRERDAANSGW
jgi:hypothetical protein